MPTCYEIPGVGPFWLPTKDTVIGDPLRRGDGCDEWLDPVIREVWEGRLDRSALECAVDVGAYAGWTTRKLLSCYQTVIAFEPDKILRECIRRNLYREEEAGRLIVAGRPCYDNAGVPMVRARQEDQLTPLGLTDEIPSPGSIAWVRSLDGQGILTTKLDHFAHLPIGFIKIDAQGADLRVVLGALEVIKKWQPAIVFEWEPKLAALHGDVWDDYARTFVELDYQIKPVDGDLNFLALPR